MIGKTLCMCIGIIVDLFEMQTCKIARKHRRKVLRGRVQVYLPPNDDSFGESLPSLASPIERELEVLVAFVTNLQATCISLLSYIARYKESSWPLLLEVLMAFVTRFASHMYPFGILYRQIMSAPLVHTLASSSL